MANKKNIRVGISIGDINGIGPEVVMKTFSDSRMLDSCTPIIFCPSKVIAYYRKTLHLKNFHFTVCDHIKDIKHKQVNILASTHEEIPMKPGTSTEVAGKIALESLEAATEALKNNEIDVLVTAPINKENIQSDTFSFPGHTEFLKDRMAADEALMLMVNDSLRIAVATGHIPVSEISNTLTSDIIVNKAEALHNSLVLDFMIRKPKVAILAINPHAGDNGLIGSEEQDYLNDTIEALQDQNILAYGPFPADGFFATGMYLKYDAILAMYHDQGLVPFKTLSFQNGVNYTAGLPFVRTSPDHGTAYDLAGQGKASEQSFRKAVFQAIDIFNSRTENQELEKNKINPKEISRFLLAKKQAYHQKQKLKSTTRKQDNNERKDVAKPRPERRNTEREKQNKPKEFETKKPLQTEKEESKINQIEKPDTSNNSELETEN